MGLSGSRGVFLKSGPGTPHPNEVAFVHGRSGNPWVWESVLEVALWTPEALQLFSVTSF